ncbi:MAG: cytidine deaminase [Desulfurococcales archaeon]|nr:cytidine deaminase [Desulfurococcales archaeon]
MSRLRSLIERSYSPYSGFRVASIAVDEEGRAYPGVNVENASYGLTMCAERVAIFNAITSGARRIKRIYVASEAEEPVPPCGACLQVMAEHGGPDMEVTLVSLTSGAIRRYRLKDLLPHAFTPDMLEGGRSE